MAIGERIAARRIELGMTQEELAKKLGYKSRSSINKIETGANSLTQKKILALANALDTTPEYIIGWHHCDPEKYILRLSFLNQEDYDIAKELIETAIKLDQNDALEVLHLAEFKLSQDKYKKATLEGGEVG